MYSLKCSIRKRKSIEPKRHEKYVMKLATIFLIIFSDLDSREKNIRQMSVFLLADLAFFFLSRWDNLDFPHASSTNNDKLIAWNRSRGTVSAHSSKFLNHATHRVFLYIRAFASRRPPAALAPALSQMKIGFEPMRVCVGLTMLWITGVGGGGGGCVRACGRENMRAWECVRACVQAGGWAGALGQPCITAFA